MALIIVACQPSPIAGTYECPGTTELPSPPPGFDLVWVWELHEDGTLKITVPAGTVFKGTWSAEGDAGVATVEGNTAQFTIESDRIMFETGACFRR